MEVDNKYGYLKFDKTYRSNGKIYEEYHGGATSYNIYWYLIQFSSSGLYKVKQIFDYGNLEDAIKQLSKADYVENLFYQLDISEIKFVIPDYGSDNIFNGRVLKNGIVGKYTNLQVNKTEVFELLK